MRVKDIKSIAKSLDIKPGRMNKVELIKAIQRAEGNFDCYATACEQQCDQLDCIWREDCFTNQRAA